MVRNLQKKDQTATVETILDEASKTFRDTLLGLPRLTIQEFAYGRSGPGKRPMKGVYLFFSPDGELLYIGETKNVRSRVRAHLSFRDGSLVSRILQDRSVEWRTKNVHRCKCGAEIPCGSGEIPIYRPQVAQDLREEIRTTHLVAAMEAKGPDRAQRLFFERLIHGVMKPKYGFSHQ